MRQRYQFVAKKALPHPERQACEYQTICHGGCPKHRHDARREFGGLDHFCGAYKVIFAGSVDPLKKELARIGMSWMSVERRS
jgi:uncharacterized protein